MPEKTGSNVSDADLQFMKRALSLAEKGRGMVSPNPMVGAVVVKDGKIVGEGYHERFGEAHAEVNALNQAGDDSIGATLYVTLEPCSHQGKTGPCTQKIYEAGISRVVVGIQDPNPLVDGKGFTFLRSKGITVTDQVLAEKCRELNEGYFFYIKHKRPLITLKFAQTLDGRIATSSGHSKWITSEDARAQAHKLRARNDAILIGIGTVLMDDPSLTVRMTKGVSPRRIVLDSQLRVPLDASVLSNELPGQTVIITTENASKEKISRILEKNAHVLIMEADERGWVPQEKLWNKLAEIGITSVVVEGGSSVYTECLKHKFADKFYGFIAPKILGSGIDTFGDLNIRNINSAIKLSNVAVKRLSTDFLMTGDFQEL